MALHIYFWLAIHIAICPPPEGDMEKSASFMKGFMLQFVNVKIYLFGITALTGYITDYSTNLWVLVLFELMIATIGTVATLTWIGMGVLIQKAYAKALPAYQYDPCIDFAGMRIRHFSRLNAEIHYHGAFNMTKDWML